MLLLLLLIVDLLSQLLHRRLVALIRVVELLQLGLSLVFLVVRKSQLAFRALQVDFQILQLLLQVFVLRVRVLQL